MSDDKPWQFKPGNRFWEARSSHGRDKLFETKEILWASCVEYFEWVDDNPLYESKAFAFQGTVTQEPVAKMRAMTIDGLCLFLEISTDTWDLYRKRDDFIGVTHKAEQVIKSQKFAGAAADLLNANIIARDLGLVEKKEVDNKVKISDLTDEQLDHKLQSLINATSTESDTSTED